MSVCISRGNRRTRKAQVAGHQRDNVRLHRPDIGRLPYNGILRDNSCNRHNPPYN